ncbi:MAG TPA: EscU/YscU/HrcU family type III secretion system export apparatus switch protein [Bryobacteraceae bacterium]|nr:EscU/YscU/HrcU family type III secretion system export apparatus switch protein [Bryobacteraceae bacterium]
MADGQTEQPTKRRREKARREGQFAASRELTGAAQFLAFVALLRFWTPQLMDHLRSLIHQILEAAFRPAITLRFLTGLYRAALIRVFYPVLLAGAVMALVGLAAQLGVTRFGFSPQMLAPDIGRLNPLKKLKDLPAQNFAAALQAAILFPVIGLALYGIARDNLEAYLRLPSLSFAAGLAVVSHSLLTFFWRAAFAFVLLGVLDMIRQQRRFTKSLRMSKQEIRQEQKESEGSPEIKARIRRLQRDAARRNMMKAVPAATAVIVNPTHYAVAIRYELEKMAAPQVVAKGKNYLARRIREIAISNQVPIVENQPLAQALYKSADVGQEIPPHLYRAVAEILAYIFKLMNRGRA